MTDFIEVIFEKPLSNNFLFLRDKYIRKAKREGKLLKIVTPNGTHYTTPETWLKGAKKMDQVFKVPNRPMHLVGNYATPNEPSMDEYLASRKRIHDLLKEKGIIK